MKTLEVRSSKRNQMIDITSLIQKEISELGIRDAICILYVPHTTAGITINEGADPAVVEDILEKLSELVPYTRTYHHLEGNADSHIKSTLVGCSVAVLIEGGRLQLGTWQRIFFCEFDGPRRRKVYMGISPVEA